ncbi:type II toxin-antitoxin system YafQ family toxin [Poseidonibacter sp. 1_MG-2023]|uniref:type II toxin-antitoxin system RelE/ParE family toxin n=1 Tax=Poseidonibacter TaxID=2321187 RepID=UPI001E506381|nr:MULTISPECIES: type II toxin-antitoxin system YafQ family toxin [Poseidonibacter]MDO6826828.1 type II toxin-antitoxin system YafQ family toxin [Poseidonibacter sp. 1_MG-2023]
MNNLVPCPKIFRKVAIHDLTPFFLDHALKGDYKSFREFHISGDMLIIYIIENNYLKLVRIGTHSQLFE